MPYDLRCFVNGPLEQNCYFLGLEGRPDGVLVDPGSDPDLLRRGLAGRVPALLLATHGHFDHIGAAAALAKAYGCPFAMARPDEFLLDDLEDAFAAYGMGPTERPGVDFWLEPGREVQAAGLTLKVLGTPGHTPGSVCFFHAGTSAVFSGDTLFAGTVGRSDFPGGDHGQLIASIRRELLSLPDLDKVRVLPGHGEASTLGEEARHNRFLR